MDLIVAVDRNWGIGNKNDMPWHIKEDLAYFKRMTLNKTIVMGRKTFLSFPKQKPLVNRKNIILTRDKKFIVEGATTMNGVKQLLNYVQKKKNSNDIFIIGGQSIYQTFEAYCERAYITKIDYEYEVDTYFPNFDMLDHWKIDKINETLVSKDGISFTVYEYINTQI